MGNLLSVRTFLCRRNYLGRISQCTRHATVSMQSITTNARMGDQAETKLVWCCRLRFVAESRETILQSAETNPKYRGGAPAVASHMLESKFDICFV